MAPTPRRSLLSRLRGVFASEVAPVQRAPWDDYWYTAAAGGVARDTAGQAVTPDSALTIGAVYRAVRLLSDDVAQLPLHLYRLLPDREDGPGGKERVRSPLAEVLGRNPNPRQTSFEFRQQLTSHLLLRGNGYARIVAGARGAVDALIPISPQRVRPVLLDTGRVLYLVTDKDGGEKRLTQDEVFHVRGFTMDAESAEGMSIVAMARTSLGLSLAMESFGARQFSQTPKPSVVLKHPGSLDADVAKRISATFRAASCGQDNWGATPLLEDGVDLIQVGMSHDDAQYLEGRQFQVTDVARWFGLPPHMIGDLSRATYSNIEQQSIDYLTHSLMPWLVLWEQSISRDLILDETFPQFVLDGLLRGDSVSRAQAQQLRVNMRALTPNEVRAQENLNPVAWGDDPAMPQGAPAPFGRAPAPPAEKPEAVAPDDDEPEPPKAKAPRRSRRKKDTPNA